MNLDVQQGLNFLKKESSFLKIRGIRKLAQSKDRDARRILREFLASKPPPELVEATEEAIEELEKYFNLIDSVKLVDRKQTAIDMEEKERERALKVFDDKIQILASRLSKEKSEYVRATLVKEIGRFKNVFTIDILIAYLQDPDDRVRANTVEALTMIRSPLIIPHIAPLLSDPNGRVKANVLKALWTFGSHEIYPYLEKMMATGSPAEKKSALFVLKNIKTVDSYRLVKESLNDPDMEVSETARKLLPEFGLIGLTSLIEGPLAFAKSRAVLVAVGSLLLVIIVFTVTIYLMSGPEDIPKKIIITRRS
ncbi:MAG: HEAT repeat domain-containing protein, partial [bacterium]|nr:HEAT repeat domain-containing protein [bacterium]